MVQNKFMTVQILFHMSNESKDKTVVKLFTFTLKMGNFLYKAAKAIR
jgi:hypothetical protein